MSLSVTVSASASRCAHDSRKLLPVSPMFSTLDATPWAIPVKSFFHDRPTPINCAGTEAKSVNGSVSAPTLPSACSLQVGELLRHLGQLPVKRDLRHGVLVDLDSLVGDHLRPLDARQDRAEDGVGGSGGQHDQKRDNNDSGQNAVFHFQSPFGGRGTSTSEVNQTRSRCPARMVMVGRRFKKRSRMRVAAWPSPCPAPARKPATPPS